MSKESRIVIKTKQNFREKIWIHMVKEELTISSRNLCNRIPYFKGAVKATQRLNELDKFKEAKLLMISPDKPQESAIILSLQKEKEILIPKPRLITGLFLHVKNAAKITKEDTQNVVTRHSIKQIESPVGFDTINLKVDMLILGSVCVNKAGYRIGDGEGFADLEYAILSKMKAVNESTIIVTTVHDCQILDIPEEIFELYDVPVDIIVTPTQTIVINPKLQKPTEIIWSVISNRRLAAIPILNEIKKSEEIEGKIWKLKEVDSDIETRKQDKLRVKKVINKLQSRLRRRKLISDSSFKESKKEKEIRRKRFLTKRKLEKTKENEEDSNDIRDKMIEKQSMSKQRGQRQRSGAGRNQVNFSLRLSNIASTVRVRDLKNALHERGVKPSNITWYGQRGFCYLHFGKLRKHKNAEDQPLHIEKIVASLKQLKVSEDAFILVEPAEPIIRIEVTDVSIV